MMTLRPYQRTCIDRIKEELLNHSSTLFVAPTGAGKTCIFSQLIAETPGRVLVLAHRQVLIHQTVDKIKATIGETAAIEMGEHWSNECRNSLLDRRARIVASSIQTQISGARGEGRMSRFNPNDFAMVICDECHHSVSDSFKKVLEYYRKNPKLKLVGCSASPDRADEEALGQIYETVAYNYELLNAIEDGWLVPINQRSVYIESLDFSGIRTTAGDLNGADLALVLEQEKNLHKIADPLFEMAAGRPTVVFTASVAQAERLAEILCRHQHDCARAISAETPHETRENVFSEFREGRINFILNCNICSEGWDMPSVAVVAMARPTKSRALYAQQAGRGTRPLPGTVDGLATSEERKAAIAASHKPNLEIMDFVGNAGRHVLVSSADILGGNFTDEEIKRAKRDSVDCASRNVIEGLHAARRELEMEKARAAANRARIVGKARYTTRTVDPFDVFGIVKSNPHGWDKGKIASDKQRAILIGAGIEKIDSLTLSQVSQLIGEIFQRRKNGKCSFKQAKLLGKYGYDRNMSFEDAKKTIDALAANQWKPIAAAAPAPAAVDFSEGCSDPVTEFAEAPF